MSLIKNKINYILGKNFDFKIGFIICGTQKGGTPALDRYLRLHPEICMANKKEVHFFDSDKYFQKQNPDFSKYHFHFNPKVNLSIPKYYLLSLVVIKNDFIIFGLIILL